MLAAGGVGAVVGVFVSEGRAAPARRPSAPPPLRRALDRELALVADLDAALRRGAGPAAALRAVHADHVAHAAALRSALAGFPAPTPSPTPSSTTAPTVARLRAAELAAAHAAAADSASLTGAEAALLASISACEATHEDLLG